MSDTKTPITKEELAAQVREQVCEALSVAPERVTDTTTLSQDLGADDLDRVELVMDLEERYNILIEDDMMDASTTFGQLVECVYTQIKKGDDNA